MRSERVERVAIGFLLEAARVVALQQEGRHRDDDRAGRTDVAGKQRGDDEHERAAQGLAQGVPMLLVADLVGDDGIELAVVAEQVDQLVGDDDDAAGHGERIRSDAFGVPEHHAVTRSVRKAGHEPVEPGAQLGLAGTIELARGEAEVAIELAEHLVAETRLDLLRHLGGDMVGQPRHAPDEGHHGHDQAEHDRGGNRLGMAFEAIDQALQAVVVGEPLVEPLIVAGHHARTIGQFDRAQRACQARGQTQRSGVLLAIDIDTDDADPAAVETPDLDFVHATAQTIEVMGAECVHRPMSMSNRPSTSAAVASTSPPRSARMPLKSSNAIRLRHSAR